MPGVVALELILARTPRVAVWVGAVAAYPTGLMFSLTVQVARRWAEDAVAGAQARAPFSRRRPWDPGDGEWFGVRFADGREATTLDERRLGARPPGEPLLLPWGAGITGGRIEQALWLRPLPPAGRLTIVGAWPALDLPETRHELDAEPLRAAARRAVTLWPGC